MFMRLILSSCARLGMNLCLKTLLSEDHFIDRLRPLCVRNYTRRLLLSTTEDFTMGNLVLYGECLGLAYTFLKVNV